MTQIPEELIQVGGGWHPLLMELHERLVAICPNYFVGQVKEKFGTLRVYLDTNDFDEDSPVYSYPEEVWEEISKAERASAKVCEFCGKPGELNYERHWIKTLCQECK